MSAIKIFSLEFWIISFLILASLILHDTYKHGLNGSRYTVTEHPTIAANEILNFESNLNSEYKQNNESVWTNLTFLLDNTGKFKIKYNYDDVLKSEFTSGERQIIWEYEVLGVEPELKEYKEMINKYLESKNNLQ